MATTTTTTENPIAGALFWEPKPDKLRLHSDAFEFIPTTELDQKDEERAAWRIRVNGREAGEVLFDEVAQKFFHLEPVSETSSMLKRAGQKNKFEDSVLSLLKTRFPEEFERATWR